MKTLKTFALACAVSALALNGAMAQSAPAAAPAGTYEPKSGQEGKDVVWVPTPQALVDRMMQMAGVTKDDYLVDLGSGDGRTVITAAKLGVRAHGIEFNGDLVELSKRNAQAAGVADRATFQQGDIFESNFSDATVVTLFLLKALNVKLRPILLDMKPGTRIVSNTFDMGDWTPDDKIDAGAGCTSWCTAYKWVIPAKVDGNWRLGEGELKLSQTYQMLSGTMTTNGKSVPISDAKMNGAQISFTAGGQQYTGTVADGKMSGKTAGGQSWSATR
ncbi:MAG TPA: methyltransferase domain-containing protein [Pseudolabrys sp.]|nr:methyltransferase domain-containing protein [Pseudolabrys sp.]